MQPCQAIASKTSLVLSGALMPHAVPGLGLAPQPPSYRPLMGGLPCQPRPVPVSYSLCLPPPSRPSLLICLPRHLSLPLATHPRDRHCPHFLSLRDASPASQLGQSCLSCVLSAACSSSQPLACRCSSACAMVSVMQPPHIALSPVLLTDVSSW